MKTPHPLLDAIIKDNHLRSDAHLADELKMGRSAICDLRHKRREVSGDIRCAIIRRFGMPLKRIDELAPLTLPKGEA